MREPIGEDHPVLVAIRNAPLRKEPMTAEERAYYDDVKARIEAGKPNLFSGEFFSLLRADGEMTGEWIDARIAAESQRRGIPEPELLDLGRRTRAALSEADGRLRAMAAGEEPALPMAQVYAEVKAKYGLAKE